MTCTAEKEFVPQICASTKPIVLFSTGESSNPSKEEHSVPVSSKTISNANEGGEEKKEVLSTTSKCFNTYYYLRNV